MLNSSPEDVVLYAVGEKIFCFTFERRGRCTSSGGAGGGTAKCGLYGEDPPERGTFFRLWVYI